MQELKDWDEGVVELSVARTHRVILNTMHGQVIIDVRADDVNAFVLGKGGRKDFLLIPDDKSAAADKP